MKTDDLVILAVLAIEQDPIAASKWSSENCRHILCDNFENAKPMWYRFLSLLMPFDGSMIMAVNPSQSVRGWLGGQPRMIRQILAEVPGSEVLNLKINYRSAEPLLAIANRLSPEDQAYKAMYTHIFRGLPYPKPVLMRIDGSLDEMDECIIDHIVLDVSLGYSYSDVACLSRRLSTLRRLATKCESRGIPYRVYSANRCEEMRGPEGPAVTLSTIHAAQGEEWKIVWVVDVNDGIMPGPIPEPNTRWTDEERCLFHVCATRATEILCFCYAADRASGFGITPSRFFDDLMELLEHFVVQVDEPEAPVNWWLGEE